MRRCLVRLCACGYRADLAVPRPEGWRVLHETRSSVCHESIMLATWSGVGGILLSVLFIVLIVAVALEQR